jgi:hypothetical protein
MRPNDRKKKQMSDQVRTEPSHRSSRRPEASAAIANANGIVAATKPM